MNKKEIKISDYFKIDDSHSKIRGFVFAYDDDGNLVFHKENMIVASGRKMILNAITGRSNPALNLSALKVKVGSGTDITTPGMKGLIKSINDNNPITFTDDVLYIGTSEEAKKEENVITLEDANEIKGRNVVIIDEDNIWVSYKFSISSADITGDDSISELGLFLGNKDDDGGEKMFSRVVFQPYTLSTNTDLNFTYYIYF